MAAHAGPVGAFCNFKNGTWPSSITTQNQAWNLWNSATGTTAQSAKIFYYNLSEFPTALDYQTTSALNLGIKPVICCKPDYTSNATMAADLPAFTAMCNMFKSHGLSGWIVLWQEPQNGGKTPPDPTGPEFRALFEFDPNGTGVGAYHAAANAAGFKLVYDAASHTPSAWATYMPGGQYLDAVAVDYYCDTYVGGIRIHGSGSIMDLADAAGVPFGVFEVGITPGSSTEPTIAEMTSYLGYLEQIMGWNAATSTLPAGRLHQGLANAPVMWYNGTAPGELGLNQIIPQATAPANAPLVAYCISPGYPNLWQALQPSGPSGPSITTSSLPGGVVGTAYSATIAASGGTAPYTWSHTGSLPAGLTGVNGTAGPVLSGTPTAAGSYTVNVTVTDAASLTATASLPITISAAAPALTITTTSLAGGVVGTGYASTLAATGGTSPYTWSKTGSLPAGLTLHSATGVIDGTPTIAGTASFTVTVTDSATPTPATATVSLTITVTAATPALAITTTSLPPGLTGTVYSGAVNAANGTPPYTWAHTGSLPPGLHGLSATAGNTLSGTPTTAGSYPFTVTVTDSATPTPATASQALTVTVSGAVPLPVRASPAIPGLAQPGTFTPGLQGTASPLNLLSTPAVPGVATPGTFTPGDPGSQSLPTGPPFSPSTPGQAVPGLFTPGDPGAPLGSGSAAPFIAQQASQTATFSYGWSALEFSGNAPGNMLVVMAGWDLNVSGTAAAMPAAYVCDSALNYWYHAGTTTAGNTGSRCSVWVAPNAQPVEWVSCSLTTFASSLAWTVIEVGNAPQFFSIDVSAAASGQGTTALDASPGLTGSADLGLACLVRGGASGGLAAAPAGWTALGEEQAGAGQLNGVSLFPFWNPSVPAGTGVTVGFVNSYPVPLSAVTVLIEADPNPPLQPDPEFPRLLVEAAFGFSPGDSSQSPPGAPGAASDTIWTDITARCAAKDGTPYIVPALGKSYELSQPETGELAISCDNHDGAFTPGNVNSPYAPGTGVVLGTPVRVSAYWGGSWYNVAFGYVERWPQEWPDVPQWGMSAMIAADAFAALSNARSFSALNGDMLLDAPYALIPCYEQYTTQSNSLVPLVTQSECQGLLAANIAPGNQRAGTYVDGTGAQCATGQSTTLLGSQDTGFGCSQFTAPLTATSSGPGMIYWDPNVPGPLSPTGMSVEFWLTISAAASAVNEQPAVFTAFGAASNYQTAVPQLQVRVQNFTGSNQMLVQFADGFTVSVPFTPSANPQQVVLVFGQLGSFETTSVSIYVNGILAASAALSFPQFGAWQAVMLGCGNYAYHNGTLAGGVFTAMSLGIYPYELPVQRIVSHFVTGVSGQQGVDATTRIAQVLAWSGTGVPRGGRVTFGGAPTPVLQGPAYSLSNANVSSVLNQVAANEQGMLFASPDGTLQFAHRWALFNQQPEAVFGDDPAAGEIPFLPGQAFDYDNSKLFNIDQVTQTIGPTTGVVVTSQDTNSQAAYFTRSPQQLGVQTMSNLDAYDLANWSIAVYSQPQIRLRGLTVDAAANPLVAFPAVLGLQQANAATVNRRPLGGVPVSANVIVQKVSHSIGPKIWQTSYEMSPYGPLSAVLQLDMPINDVIGENVLP